jgi:hypothetical protein
MHTKILIIDALILTCMSIAPMNRLCKTCCINANNVCAVHEEKEHSKGPTKQDVTSDFTNNLCIPCHQTDIFSTLQAPHSNMEDTLRELAAASGRSSSSSSSSSGTDSLYTSTDDRHVAKKKKLDADTATRVDASAVAPPTCVDWSTIPGSCLIFGGDGKMGGKKRGQRVWKQQTQDWKKQQKDARVERKERQCDAFVAAISALCLPPGAVVVDGGCGSCGLTLPLAHTFPHLTFVGIDMNPFATKLMMERVETAQLKNVQAFTSSISAFTDHFDLAIGLHACGQASDDIINLAVTNRKPYLVAPCCFGKLKFSFRSHSSPAPAPAVGSEAAAEVPARGTDESSAAPALPLSLPLSLPLPLPPPVKRGPTPPRAIDENHLGYVARRLKENEGKWDALVYPRSSWLQTQLEAGAEGINRAAIRQAQERMTSEKRSAEEKEGGGGGGEGAVAQYVSCFSDRGDSRILSLEDRMNSLYLAVAGYADNSHMRSVPEVVRSRSVDDPDSSALPPPPPSPSPPSLSVTKTEKQLKKDMEHEFYRMCSNVICVDRNEFAVERAGYCTRICTMPGLASSAKSDILIGWLPGPGPGLCS